MRKTYEPPTATLIEVFDWTGLLHPNHLGKNPNVIHVEYLTARKRYVQECKDAQALRASNRPLRAR